MNFVKNYQLFFLTDVGNLHGIADVLDVAGGVRDVCQRVKRSVMRVAASLLEVIGSRGRSRESLIAAL